MITPDSVPSVPSVAKKLVVIGGGGGASQVALAARPHFAAVTVAVAVTDTGRSTGTARALANIPAPGDLRNTLANLARDPAALWPRLLQHRFHSQAVPALDGMAFGNLLIAALAELTGDFAQAIAAVAELTDPLATVLPVSTTNTQLCAELADGSIMRGELAVRGLRKPPIRRLFLADPAPAYPPLLEAIAAADLVAVGPGSFFTSVLAALLCDGLAAALQNTRAQVVFICNSTTQPGQTDGFTALDHVRHLVDLLGPGTLDSVLVNRSPGLPPELLAQYAAEGLHLLTPGDDEIAAMAALGVTPLVADYTGAAEGKRALWNKLDTIRYDPRKIGETLERIVGG